MQTIETTEELEALYGEAFPGAITKVFPHLTPCYRQWIEQARFLILTTVGPEGTDASPRGDRHCVVRIQNNKTLWLPDWRGNNRTDSLRNIVRDGRLSLLFMVPGCKNVVRVNGNAVLTADAIATSSFTMNNRHPRSVIIVSINEVYYQCAKALMRSELWQAGDESDRVPSAGDFLREVEAGFDARAYDDNYADYAKGRMW